jgi:hypothetical protein
MKSDRCFEKRTGQRRENASPNASWVKGGKTQPAPFQILNWPMCVQSLFLDLPKEGLNAHARFVHDPVCPALSRPFDSAHRDRDVTIEPIVVRKISCASRHGATRQRLERH